MEALFEDEIIYRRDRRRSISIFADPSLGTSSQLLASLAPKIEAIELPEDYSLEWGGELEDSGVAKASIAASIPNFIGAMVLLTILLFNSLRQPLAITIIFGLIVATVLTMLVLPVAMRLSSECRTIRGERSD